MMRTKFFLMMLAAIVMGSQVTLFAQEKKGAKSERRQFNKEQMLEIQCNQIIKGLALDDATTAKFIPVYKQYMEEMRATRHMGVCRNVANRTKHMLYLFGLANGSGAGYQGTFRAE